MTDYTELKRLAEDVNNSFPDKEDLWSMVCTPTVALDLIADFDQVKAENELMRHRLAACAKELRSASDWICKEVEVPTKSATHWAIRLKTNADQVDGALGKGEQS